MAAGEPIQLARANQWFVGNASAIIYQPGGITPISGYVTPNLQTLRGNHTGPMTAKVTGMWGQTTSRMFAIDDELEMTFTFKPEGASIAEATINATIPVSGSLLYVTGLKSITIGRFSNALNGPTSGLPVWIYDKGASIDIANNDSWSITLPMVKNLYITTGVPIA